jgi:hypothetical protein
VDNRSQEGATAPFAHPSEPGPADGVSRRRALGVAGVGVAGALLPAAHADAAEAAAAPSGAPTALTAAQVAVITAVARTMASVPVALPFRAGKDPHPLDRVSEIRIRTLVGHLAPSQATLTRQGIGTLAAAGIGSARPAAVASAIAEHTEWDEDPGVGAALLLATATATPLGFCAAFPHAWRTLLRTRNWPMIAATAAKEAS